MNAQEILESEDFKKCVNFHGHICPGLSIGYKAAKACMEAIKEIKSEDEELVAIVETDACSADAVQVLTGCTFGKGNFFYKDYGKMALTLISRNYGKGVRVSARPDAFAPNREHTNLSGKIRKGEANEKETKRFKQLHFQKTCDILEKPYEELFIIKRTSQNPPPKARIENSEICDECKEAVMSSKLESINNKKICRGCAVKS
ncbi:MAG: formylmethanofuran dehydrogenase [Deltaproteobacteria bacterium]|nr:formylmethanofuran dehydrogenase [Deltaproteobacteria bacterium]